MQLNDTNNKVKESALLNMVKKCNKYKKIIGLHHCKVEFNNMFTVEMKKEPISSYPTVK